MSKNKINGISAQRINQVLQERNLNKSELSRLLGVSAQAVQQWADGISKPTGKNLAKLSAIFNKPEYWFFMRIDEMGTNKVLTPQQERLLDLFEQMPASEKEAMINLFDEKVKYLDKLREELIAIKNKSN